jgi:hypothetical protein
MERNNSHSRGQPAMDGPERGTTHKRSALGCFDEIGGLPGNVLQGGRENYLVRRINGKTTRQVERAVAALEAMSEAVSSGISNIHYVEEWRGDRKLVPVEWLQSSK